MAKRGSRGTSRGKADNQPHLSDFRHESATRKNNPPAKIAAEGSVPAIPRVEYRYSPRRPPVLRFDPKPRHAGTGPHGHEGGVPADELPELLAEAGRRPLTPDEQKLLAEALRTHEPWLEWASKHEQHQRGHFSVDPVALHIHERVSAQAILKVAARQDAQRSLFADPQHEYHEAVQFYKHDIDWASARWPSRSLDGRLSTCRASTSTSAGNRATRQKLRRPLRATTQRATMTILAPQRTLNRFIPRAPSPVRSHLSAVTAAAWPTLTACSMAR